MTYNRCYRTDICGDIGDISLIMISGTWNAPLTVLHSNLLFTLTEITADFLRLFIASNRHRSTFCAKQIDIIGTNITLKHLPMSTTTQQPEPSLGSLQQLLW